MASSDEGTERDISASSENEKNRSITIVGKVRRLDSVLSGLDLCRVTMRPLFRLSNYGNPRFVVKPEGVITRFLTS